MTTAEEVEIVARPVNFDERSDSLPYAPGRYTGPERRALAERDEAERRVDALAATNARRCVAIESAVKEIAALIASPQTRTPVKRRLARVLVNLRVSNRERATDGPPPKDCARCVHRSFNPDGGHCYAFETEPAGDMCGQFSPYPPSGRERDERACRRALSDLDAGRCESCRVEPGRPCLKGCG